MEKILSILDTRNKKIIAGAVSLLVVVLIVICAVLLFGLKETGPALSIKKDNMSFEFGEKLPDSAEGYQEILDYSNVPKDEVKNIKVDINSKNAVTIINNEDGTQTEKEEDYPEVGEYDIAFMYDNVVAESKIIVKDTTEPELTVPENIEIIQGTDLNTFDFKSLLTATDLSALSDYTIDYSSVDVNIPAEYTIKVSIIDQYKNKAEKEVKVTITALPEVAADEVVVQEIVTNEDGTTTVRNTVKKASEASASGNKVVANSSGATSGNTNTGNSSNTGNTGGNSTGNTTNSNNGSTSSSGGNSSSSNGNTGGSTSGGSSTGGSSSSNTGNSSGNSGNSSSGGSSSSEPAPSEPKVITYWVRCKLCGTYVESTVSLDDAFNKISNYKCVDSGGYEYVDFMKHSSYSYGANEG